MHELQLGGRVVLQTPNAKSFETLPRSTFQACVRAGNVPTPELYNTLTAHRLVATRC